MSKAIASNATELASPGMSLDNFDVLRVKEIVFRHATTKNGGLNFQSGVLFTKVCKEIKSLCSIHSKARLPDGIAKTIMGEIEALPVLATKALTDDGYNLTRQSGAKVRVSFRDLNVSRAKTRTYSRLGSLEDQCKDLHWKIVETDTAIGKLEAMQPKDLEQRQAIETKIEKLTDDKTKFTRLLKILKNELKEQKELVEKSS